MGLNMQTVKNLLNSNTEKTLGNHRVVHYNQHQQWYYYFETPICKVCNFTKTFVIDASYGTQSTTRACNAYRHNLLQMGYTEVEKLPKVA